MSVAPSSTCTSGRAAGAPIRSMRMASAMTYWLAWSESRTVRVVPVIVYGPPRSCQAAPWSLKSFGASLLVDRHGGQRGGAVEDGEGGVGGPVGEGEPGGRDAVDARGQTGEGPAGGAGAGRPRRRSGRHLVALAGEGGPASRRC